MYIRVDKKEMLISADSCSGPRQPIVDFRRASTCDAPATQSDAVKIDVTF